MINFYRLKEVLTPFFNNKKIFYVFLIKVFSLLLRLISSLYIVKILSEIDFTTFLKISTVSGFSLTFLNILYQNFILNSGETKINIVNIVKFNTLVFIFCALLYYAFTFDINQSFFVFIFYFTPLVYCFTLIGSLQNRLYITSLIENLLQNIFLFTLFLINFIILYNSDGKYLDLNLVLFEIFISWACVFLLSIFLFKNSILLEISSSNFFSKSNSLIYINSALLYILTKLDIFVLTFLMKNNSIVKEYYTIQKVSEIVQIGSDLLWMIYASKILSVKNNISSLKILIKELNKVNLLFLSFLGFSLLSSIYFLDFFNILHVVNKYWLIIFFIALYIISGYFNTYYLLLQFSKKNDLIFIALILTVFIIITEYITLNNVLDSFHLIIVLFSSYILISKYLYFYLSKKFILNE